MDLWISDPKSKTKSVSLTLLVISFIALLAASTLHLSKLTESTSSLTELFGICSSLYFGRRFTSKSGNTMDSPTNQETK